MDTNEHTHEMNDNPSGILVVQVNGTPLLEYDRSQTLSPKQHESLGQMDEKLDQGIFLNDQFITRPDREQRVEFMTANLVSALLEEEDGVAAASCAYLAKALPELKQIRALEQEGTISIELIFDREYQKELQMNFVPLDKLTARH